MRAEAIRRPALLLLAASLPGLRAKFAELAIDVAGERTEMPLSGDGLMLVMDHLLSNAAAHGAGRVCLRVERGGAIRVRDDGPGIPEGDLARVFEPFFTTRRDAGGTGLRLAIVRSVLAAHGGGIEARAGAKGAEFRISLGPG